MSFLTILLYPFAILYGLVTSLRNYLFDIGYKRSFEFEANVIGVGNLTVGGTGKSPMVEYLVRLLSKDFKVATLSRGYGRKTRGFRIANETDNASTIGDEPYQFKRKFKNLVVAVGEERAVAIPFMLAEAEPDVILLDDSYQHRYVKPTLNILLSDFTRPFYNDYILPAGRLRESRKGAKRADVVVVTKCPASIDKAEKASITKDIARYTTAPVFFARIGYQPPVASGVSDELGKNVLIFSGLANSSAFVEYISKQYTLVDEVRFADHHHYDSKDLELIWQRFLKTPQESTSIVTTEKDIVKLQDSKLAAVIKQWPIFYIPIEMEFVEDGNVFDKMVLGSIKKYSQD